MAAEELSVQGLTGVDVALPIAGVGTRAYAFLIDWHIRVLLALAWLLLVWLALRLWGGAAGLLGGKARWAGLALVAPAAVLYFLYHPVLELVLRGRTPGKRMAGARIVTAEGATPGSGALLMRNLFRVIDSLPVFYLVGLLFCLVTARRVRIGDLAAGTVLVIDDSRARSGSLARVGELAGQSKVPPQAATLIDDVLQRWPELAPPHRVELARGLLRRLDAQVTPGQLAALDASQLHQRLKDLISHG